jgi:rhamnulokinase
MSQAHRYVALDLGAESGRVIVGCFDGDRLDLEVAHRFPNGAVTVRDSLHWDILYLWREIKEGLGACARSCPSVDSLGVDAWAQDFGLLGADDVLLGNPYCYRDSRTEGMMEEALRHVTGDEIYRTTGNPLVYSMTTLCQLLSMVKADSPALRVAQTFLNIADLINFWLTGRKANESTLLINGQCYNPTAKRWATGLLEKLGIPTHIFGEIAKSGTVLGTLLAGVAEETGLDQVPVVAPACHDSAAAVVAVPTRERDYLFLSCGTWSVLGTEIEEPLIRPEGPIAGLGNEGGALDNVRCTTNIIGLWLVQECRRVWAAQGETYSYDELTEMAARGKTLVSLVDPNDVRFMAPGDMPERVRGFCRETGQPVPDSKPDLLRCILDSLALKYLKDKKTIEGALGRKMKVVHMVGGGIRNRLLCQLTANAMALPVLAGPVESTAMGNIIMQAVGLGHLSSVQEGRELVRASVPIETYEPDVASAGRWQEAYERFQRLS